MVRILIVSEKDDSHAIRVAYQLAQCCADVVLLDMTMFPNHIDGSFAIEGGGRQSVSLGGVNQATIDVVWWRRPSPTTPAQRYFMFDTDFTQVECDQFLEGLLWSIPCAWVNNPTNEIRASRKIYQLTTAVELGLDVPRTLVTTEVSKAREFVENLGSATITKRLGTARGLATETRILTREDLARMHTVQSCPTLFQEYIPPAGDIRVVVMGENIYSFWIDSSHGANPVDSRVDMRVAHTPYNLPLRECGQIRSLLDALGLVCGVIDLRMSSTERIYFLEVNPAGQWDYLEAMTGIPLAKHMALTLINCAETPGTTPYASFVRPTAS